MPFLCFYDFDLFYLFAWGAVDFFFVFIVLYFLLKYILMVVCSWLISPDNQ